MKKYGLLFVLIFSVLFVSDIHASDNGIIISAYQGKCYDGDFNKNMETVRRVVKEALARNSDFLCFPETFLSGYIPKENVVKGAVYLDDPRITDFIKSTADYDMVVD